jgi:hypothetical protein
MNEMNAKDISSKSIDICIDLDAPSAQEKIEGYRRAWGRNYMDVAALSDEVAVVRLYPGGAAQLKEEKLRKPGIGRAASQPRSSRIKSPQGLE